MTDVPNGSSPEGGNPAPWYAGIENPELRGLAELKRWDSVDKALESYRNLESKMGVPPERLLRLPEKPDDPAWKDVKAKVGWTVPETPDAYELPIPDGFGGEFASEARKWFHEAEVPPHIAKKLAERWNGYAQSQIEAQEKAIQQNVETSLAKLRAEWGGQYETSMALAQRVENVMKQEVGLGEESLKAWQDSDPEGYFKAMAYFGSKFGEAKYVSGDPGTDGPGVGAMSPEAAKVKLQQLMSDRDWFQRWDRGDSDARAEWKRLNDILRSAGGR